MKILILEDEDEKFEIIKAEISSAYASASLDLVRAKTLALANKYIYEQRFDLIIIDLMMPLRDNGPKQDISEEIISIIELSDQNRGSNFIALSGFEELVLEQRERFVDVGIVLVHYDGEDAKWKKHIATALARVKEQTVFDFVIVCALEKERSGYKNASCALGDLRNIRGLDCMPITIGGLQGVCIKLPRMGLVEASIVTTRAIERFNPKLVCMSGICAGSSNGAPIGTLVIADLCWEYQAGKWAGDKFKIEHYDIGIDAAVKTALSQMIASDDTGKKYKNELLEDAIVFEKIVPAPMATGSAVIASAERMAQIEEQHRKMAALDMEMYGVYKAADLSARRPLFFGVKTVVDLADSAKGDVYHEYGSVLSARFVVDAIERLLTQHPLAS
jgi:nucleoside phosphorylase